ncbi:MAG: Kazal-type serine protease inhibitor domain-containing protein [Bacteroidia bacterium]
MKKFLIVVLFLLSQKINFAQCIDSLRISPTFPCPDLLYNPVCGCDNKTYRNLCYALNRNGVLYYTEGTCTGFELDVFPNVAAQEDNITITFSQSAEKNATFMLVDVWGKVFIQRQLPAAKRFEFQLNELVYLPRGPYLAIIYNPEGKYRYVKFVKL